LESDLQGLFIGLLLIVNIGIDAVACMLVGSSVDKFVDVRLAVSNKSASFDVGEVVAARAAP